MFTTKQLSKEEVHALLTCCRLPGRLTTGETAALLGFAEHDIPILIARKQLNPLGDPAPNSPKYFAGVVIGKLASDEEWLSKATRSLARYWRQKNTRGKSVSTNKHK
jgi:hypothetical protein